MILSICLNCSLDTRYTIPGFSVGNIHSTVSPSISAGGKGLNLARVAALLGEEVTALGLVGEADLPFFNQALAATGVRARLTHVPAPTRRCLNIIDPQGSSTEIREKGCPVDASFFQEILDTVRELGPRSTVICASGSVPPGLPNDVYAQLGELARSLGKPFVLDAKGAFLQEGLRARPFAVKPNLAELEEWAGRTFAGSKDVCTALFSLNQAGVSLAVASLGEEGAIAACADRAWQIRPPKLAPANPVGSGDAFTAGLAAGLVRNLPLPEALALAAACGAANAINPDTGHIDPDQVRALLPRIEITDLGGVS